MMEHYLEPQRALPQDGADAILIGRAWLPEQPAGPAVVAVRGQRVLDISQVAATVSQLCEEPNPAAVVGSVPDGKVIGTVGELLANSNAAKRDHSRPWLLAPCDLQPVKAAGVTFVRSMLERVIEEQARGDAARAEAIRGRVSELVGVELANLRPGSPEAERLKAMLIEQNVWSQYLEVGIGPDAEIFTKCAPMASVGTGADVGLHPRSTWNNPEPEVVLVINSSGTVVGATLGNDVNLRDFEGRSALLLGRAKDNNGSSAIGPFIRLFDSFFTIETVRGIEVRLEVQGEDGFALAATSSMSEISRDPLELVAHTIGDNHQYPDGVMLFCGTMFAPTEDRGEPGKGFSHHLGDTVAIGAPELGTLVNRVGRSDQIERWSFGIGALMRHLATRHLV